jgi:hypothetical protein
MAAALRRAAGSLTFWGFMLKYYTMQLNSRINRLAGYLTI